MVNAMLGNELVTTCPYIWVDRDFALVRGWIQGFPKKLASIQMTRSFGLDCKAEGRTFAGTVQPATGGSPRARSRPTGSATPARPTTTRR